MLKKKDQVKRLLLGGAFLATPIVASATDVTTDLQTAATTAITAVLATVGAIFVAGIAIPVAKKTYRIVKSALGGA